ncbi:MAG: winged helix-turn-helix domain-containing protein [Bacteroidia bacterium]
MAKTHLLFFFLLILLQTSLEGETLWGETDSRAESLNAESVNLALRRTGHLLLLAEEDSTTTIPPVKQLDVQTFMLTLHEGFDYDQLPGILRESLYLRNITADYEVQVFDCVTDTLILGYFYMSQIPDAPVPCVGRNLIRGCSHIKVVFQPGPKAENGKGLLMTLIIVIFVLAGLIFFRNYKQPPPISKDEPATASGIHLSATVFDLSKLKVVVAETERDLTFREAKLLHYFFQHPNELLERDRIQKNVWEDEGIIVDRSLDVFVSRLRKILAEDRGLRIVNVRGVGYRLEVNEQ